MLIGARTQSQARGVQKGGGNLSAKLAEQRSKRNEPEPELPERLNVRTLPWSIRSVVMMHAQWD
jgi:hypothetical protein